MMACGNTESKCKIIVFYLPLLLFLACLLGIASLLHFLQYCVSFCILYVKLFFAFETHINFLYQNLMVLHKVYKDRTAAQPAS